MTDLFDLSGRVALVTGGNGGIGLAIAQALGRAGANVVIAARDMGKTRDAVAALEALGVPALGLLLDMGDEKSVAEAIREARNVLGRLDILVNNAGINRTAMAAEFSVDDWREVLDTNLVGAYVACREAYAHMKAGGGGKIVNIGSVTADFGSKRSIPYGASKSALVQMTRSLALAWASDNIQVNLIQPGWVETEMTTGLRDNDDPQIRRIRESITSRIPAARWAQPDDIAGAAVFLASRASDYVTGAVLTVDGGYSVA